MKQIKRFCVGIASLVVLSGNMIPTLAYANEIMNAEHDIFSTSEIPNLKHSPLFEGVYQRNLDKQIVSKFDEEGHLITQILDENDNILVSEIYKIDDNTFITTSSDSKNSYLETTDRYGQSNLSVYKKEKIRVSRDVVGNWSYTGIAIPRGAVDNAVNLGAEAALSYIGGLFGITAAAVNQILAFAGVGWSLGEMMGRALDTNGNGWIALYTRPRRAYPGGPITSYDHKTD